MVGGVALIVHNIYLCNDTPVNNYCGLVMYLSYLVLFVQMYIDKYSGKKEPSKDKKGQKKMH